MTKRKTTLNSKQQVEIIRNENDVINTKNLKILNQNTDNDIFENFLQSIWNNKNENEILFSEFLGQQKLSPTKLWDIKIDINNMDLDLNLSQWLQHTISKIIIKKLYETWKNDPDFLDKFETQFWDISNIDDKHTDLKSLVNIIKYYDEKYTQNLNISNQDIFSAIPNLWLLQDFNEQNPTNKQLISELLNRELQKTINEFKDKQKQLHTWIQNLLVPNINFVKNILKNDATNKDVIQKLETEKEKLRSNMTNEEKSNPNSKKSQKIMEINKKILSAHLNKSDEKEKEITEILQNLIDHNFDFGTLTNHEKTILAQKSITQTLNESNLFAELKWIDTEKYREFVLDLYDFDKQWETISISNEPKINLKIDKNFEKWEHLDLTNLENLKNMESFPIQFIVNIDDNAPETISMLEDPDNIILSAKRNFNGIIDTYETKSGKLRIWNKYKLDVWGVEVTANQLDDLYLYSPDELPDAMKKIGLRDIWGDKFNEIKWNNTDHIIDELLKWTDVKILHRDLEFDGKDTNKIAQLYLLSQQYDQKNLINEKDCTELLDPNEKRSSNVNKYVKDVFTELLRDYEQNWSEDDDSDNSSDSDDNNSSYEVSDELKNYAWYRYKLLENEEQQEQFKKELIKKIDDSGKFEEYGEDIVDNLLEDAEREINAEKAEIVKEVAERKDEAFDRARNAIEWKWDFEEWTRILIKNQDSTLPPQDISDSFYFFEICSISWPKWEWTFSVKARWNEIPFASPWKVYGPLPYTAEQLEVMGKSGTLYRMPPKTNNSREKSKENILNSKAVSKFTTFGDMEWQVELKWDKFVDKEWNEIKYFDRMEDSFDPEWNKPGKKISKYEIKNINTSMWTVTLKSNFEGVDDSNGTSQLVNFQYENTLTFEQFILLMESKKLKWYTNEQQEEMETKYDTKKQGRLKGRGLFMPVSIWDFISVFKKHWKAFSDKYKERQQEQEEHLENFLLSKEWLDLYKHMWNIMSLWGLLWDVKSWFDMAALEYYNERDNRIWKKIDKWYKAYSADPMYPAEYNDFLIPMLSKEGYRWNSKDRYKFAAALLIMLKKEWPYPRDFKWKVWEWHRVEWILWPAHKKRFKNFYAKKQQEINEVKDMGYSSWVRLKKMEELNKLEFQYIIGVIGGDEPFKSGDSDAQKSIWSNKFKDEMQANLDWYFNKHESEKSDLKWKSFTEAETAFLDKMSKWIHVKALAALEYMCEKAATPTEVFKVKWYLMSAMLMWIIGSTNEGTPKSIWKSARAMGFYPLFWARDPNLPEKTQKLLDGISSLDIKIQDFSSTTWYELKDFTVPTISWDYKKFNDKFQEYRKINGKNILKYIENPVYGGDNSISKLAKDKTHPYNPIFAELKKAYDDSDTGNVNEAINSITYIKEAPLTATFNTVRDYMPKDWLYHTKKEEDLADAKDLWTRIATQVQEGMSNNEDFVFYMQYYDKLFGLSQVERQRMAKSMSLIKTLKDEWKNTEAEYIRWYMFDGQMHERTHGSFPPEFKKCHDNFSKFFFDNVQKLDNKKIVDVLGANYDKDFATPYKMVSWKKWNNVVWVNDVFTNKTNAFDKDLKNVKFEKDNIINGKIKEMRKNISKFCPVKKASEKLLNSDINVNYTYDEENQKYIADIREWDPIVVYP